jgi:hypothetical protein
MQQTEIQRRLSAFPRCTHVFRRVPSLACRKHVVAAPPKLSCEVEKNLGRLRWKVGFWGTFAGGVLISRVPAQVVGSGAECDRDVRWGGCGPRMDGGGSGVPSGLGDQG